MLGCHDVLSVVHLDSECRPGDGTDLDLLDPQKNIARNLCRGGPQETVRTKENPKTEREQHQYPLGQRPTEHHEWHCSTEGTPDRKRMTERIGVRA